MKMASSLFLSDDEKTFSNQENLPSLPIPPLHKTLDRYLDSVKPLVTDEEYNQTEFLVNQFESGIGKDLHLKLCERAKYMRNWLEKWWDQGAYLELEAPHAIYMNMAGPGPYMNDVWPAKEGTQIERASLLIHHVMNFWHSLRRQTLRPHKDSKGRPLCMNQFHRMLNTTRIPGKLQSQIMYHFKTEDEGHCPGHVIVMCRGRIFSIQAVDESGIPVTAPELEVMLTMIKNECSNSPNGDGLGYLTTLCKTDWAEMRSRINAIHPENYHLLEEIEKSVLVLGLDDSNPVSETDVAWKGLGGNAENKWFDKSLNLIVFENGLIVSNCDHAPTDAMVLVSCTYFVYLKITESGGIWQGTKDIRKLENPKELKFHLDSVIHQTIQDAKIDFQKRCDSVEVLSSYFKDYGKSMIRRFKFHPDTHVQLAIQLAYYRKYKRPAPTYETATIRQFYHGRTETMRSCTNEAVAWCKAMIDPSVSKGRKFQLYQQAANRHNQLMEEASALQGCDRHLYGLYMICKEENIELPNIFTDISFLKSGGGGNYILSTSSIGYTPVYGGVAPMCTNGYGIFYKIENKQIVFFLTSWTEDTETSTSDFEINLFKSLQEMMLIINSQHQTQARL